MRMSELFMLEICQRAKREVSSIQLINELQQFTSKTTIGDGVDSSLRNLYHVIETLVKKKLLQDYYTNYTPRERMIRITEAGIAYLSSFHAAIEPFTRLLPHRASLEKGEESKGSAEEKVNQIENLLIKELYDDIDQISPDMMKRIKRASKRIAERSEISRKPLVEL